MSKLKITMCQIEVVDNKDENLEKAKSMIIESKDKGADIAILPEMFNCPHENEKFVQYSESRYNSITLDSISNIAKELNIHVLVGSIPELVVEEENNEKIYNTSFFFDDNGGLLGFHRKLHLFDIDIKDNIYFKESDTLSSGDEIIVIDTKFGKFTIAICFDMRFPELSRIMALKRAIILVFPRAFNLTTGPIYWKLLLRSRALDNQVFTIGVSPSLNKKQNYTTYGHSLISNPFAEVIAEVGSYEELIIAEIDLNEIVIVREELPLIKNRRTDLYQLKF
ncbi:MAG: carbon-nitrogen hydrolase family protein [Methanobrevibacter sp.]|jgi:predicted amidohydrolase|nr:carbon-nitrogen hydrolase family protein [Methanobrevibacter sp.]